MLGIGACVQQLPKRGEVVQILREQRGAQLAGILQADAFLDEHMADVRVLGIVGEAKKVDRVAGSGFRVRTPIHDQAHRLRAAQTRGNKESGGTVGGPDTGLGAAIEQQLHLLGIPGAPHECRRSVGVCGIHIGAGIEQQAQVRSRAVHGRIH